MVSSPNKTGLLDGNESCCGAEFHFGNPLSTSADVGKFGQQGTRFVKSSFLLFDNVAESVILLPHLIG